MSGVFFGIIGALAAAWITYTLQSRSWLFQQQRRIQEAELASINAAINSLSNSLYSRLYYSRALINAARRREPIHLTASLNEYTAMIKDYSIKVQAAKPILTREERHGFERVKSLEDDLEAPFAMLGEKIEAIARSPKAPEERELLSLEHEFSLMSHEVFRFIRDAYGDMQERRSNLFIIDLQRVKVHQLSELSTWQLFKLLFVRPYPSEY